MFDTLRYSKILEAAGISREHAEAHVRILSEIVEGDLATKQDVYHIRQDSLQLRQDLQLLEAATKRDLKEFEYRLTIKMGAISAAVMALGITVLTLLLK